MRLQHGMTLVELLVTLAVMIIVGMTVVPLVRDMVAKQRLVAAVEAIHGQLLFAKGEAYKRSQDIFVTTDTDDGTTWFVGVSDISGCDPSGGGTDCTLKYYEVGGGSTTITNVISSVEFPGVSMDDDSREQFRFDRVRGTATSGRVELEDDNYEVQIRVDTFGRLRICSPSGSEHLGRYQEC